MKKSQYILLGLFSIIVISSLYTNPQNIYEKNENNEPIETLENAPSNPEPSIALSWVDLPSVDNVYFSPDTTPGEVDSTLYTFSANKNIVSGASGN